MNERLLTRKQAAEILGVAVGTLANWQSTGYKKLPHLKIGHHVRYRLSDLEAWLDNTCMVNRPEDVSTL